MKRAVIFWILLLTTLYSTLAIVRHNRFESGGFDLGLYDQAVWQYSRFLPPYNTVKERFILGDHLTLTLPLAAPLLWLWNDARILLIAQAAWISLSTLPMFLLTQRRGFPGIASLIVAVLYSLFYGIQYAIFFDFHPVVFGVGLLSWLAYFLESKKRFFFVGTLTLLLLTQENMGLALASLGLIYIWMPTYRKAAVWFILGGIGVSLAATRAVAFFSPVGFQYQPQISHNPLTIFTELFSSPEKRQVWLYTLSWFSFLPLLSVGALTAVTFDLAQYFVTGPEFARMWSPFMHHRAILAPLVTLGAIEILGKVKKNVRALYIILALLVLSAAAQQYLFHFPLNKLTKRAYWARATWMDDNKRLLREISPDARIATQQSLIPHLSHRSHIYLMWPRMHDFPTKPCGEISCWWLDFNDSADYLIVDLHPNQWITQLLETNEHVAEALTAMEKMKVITLEKQIGDARLYRINQSDDPALP